MIPLVTSASSSEKPIISALSGQPMHQINIDRSVQSWLEDPLYSVDAFLQAGGRQAIAELMRENADIPGRFGMPAGITLYREFLGNRRALTESERRHIRELWENNKTEKDPHFGDIETYMLSSASIFEKLSVLSSVNTISNRLLSVRQMRELNAQLAFNQQKHDKAVRETSNAEAKRAQGSQGGLQRKCNKLEKDLKTLLADNKVLEAENAKLVIENNRLKAEAEIIKANAYPTNAQ